MRRSSSSSSSFPLVVRAEEWLWSDRKASGLGFGYEEEEDEERSAESETPVAEEGIRGEAEDAEGSSGACARA